LLVFGDLHCDGRHLRGLVERAVAEHCDALVSLGDLNYLPREPEGRRSVPAHRHGIDRIRVFSDSALVVNTVNGDWNLQPEHLKDLCVKAGLPFKEFADIKLSWVPREMNLEADTLASRALGRGR
jgi:hypothetical protein